MASETLPSTSDAAHNHHGRPSFELPTQPKNQSGRNQGGWSRYFLALGVVGAMGTAGVYTWPHVSNLGGSADANNWLTEPAVRQRLILKVTEDGNIESASNIDVKCEVTGGSTILWIVEDGKHVEEGEIIVRLNESAVNDLLNAQHIIFEKAEALRIQAEQDFDAAKIAVEAYEKGTFIMERQNLEATVKIALENLRGAENLYNHTQRMFRKGFVTKQQLEADEFGVQRSELELKSAETALDVLVKFTKGTTLTALVAARDAAAARTRSETAACALEKSKLDQLEAQKANCVIKAPQSGMVIFANDRSRRSSSEVSIEEGAAVRERQSLIKLPDLTRMHVKVPVHETKVEQLKLGMPARVVVQDREYVGHVVNIANQPEPKSWFSAEVKLYATTVAIEGETQNLKPGMTAEVEIFVADVKDALTVNVSAVVEQRGKFFIWVVTDAAPERRPVLLGRTDENVVEIKDGVLEGEQVLLNPRAILEEAREDEPLDDADRNLPDGIPTGPDAGTPRKKKPSEKSAEASSGPNPGSVPNLSEMDQDKDGKISRAEAPDRMKENFDRLDGNQDGLIDAAEWAALQQRRQQQKPAPNPAGVAADAASGED